MQSISEMKQLVSSCPIFTLLFIFPENYIAETLFVKHFLVKWSVASVTRKKCILPLYYSHLHPSFSFNSVTGALMIAAISGDAINYSKELIEKWKMSSILCCLEVSDHFPTSFQWTNRAGSCTSAFHFSQPSFFMTFCKPWL